jgi:cytochrome c biogenesis protein
MNKLLQYSKKSVSYCFNFLASLNLAVFVIFSISLLILIQILSEKIIAAGKSWKWLEFIASIDFYQSKGFTVLLLLFCVNLFACSVKRLPRAFRVFQASSREFNEGIIASLPIVERFKVKDNGESEETLSSAIATHFRKPICTKKEGGNFTLYAERGRYTHLGFHFAHLSILAIVLGVLLSSTGYEYSFQISKGQLLDPLVIRDSEGKRKSLDFSLLCEDYRTIYYKGTSEVGKHESTLTILNNGEKVKTQMVDFGHPLKYQGIAIYQDRFSRKVKYAKIKVASGDGETEIHEVKSGSKFTLKGIREGLIVTRLRSKTAQLRGSSSASRIWVSKNPTGFPEEKWRGYQFSLDEVYYKESTSLKAIRDPGMGVIWYATFCMLAGFGVIFFMPHRQIWLSLEGEEEKVLTLAGSTTKNLASLEETCANIVKSLGEVLDREGTSSSIEL